MNSLNIISASVLGTSRPVPQRARSVADASRQRQETPPPPKRAQSYYNVTTRDGTSRSQEWSADLAQEAKVEQKGDGDDEPGVDEKTPLLQSADASFAREFKLPRSRTQHFLARLSGSITETVKWFFGKLFAPGLFLLEFFYTEDGHFSPLTPIWRLTGKKGRKPAKIGRPSMRAEKRPPRSSRTRGNSSESEGDFSTGTEKGAGQMSSSDESTAPRKSIRIRQNEETARRRKQKKKPSTAEESIAKELKSPTSPSSDLKLTKYPHAPAPPRPLIPRRQPSYSSKPPQPTGLPRKTLVLDLDETLIHSMAKGGRMSTGHMVEVKLSAPTAYGGVALGPQHPILYYVHKRPFCDEFLRQVSKWYDLVIFTASVQEYADPVIDWLELERKYFTARKYRQHCTFRNGAYIKDLGSIEPDLSRVMILDNSPLSYIFHEDNAIPIEGWISDPTDSDLMHLIPLLEGLQFVTDVRAFLGLRRGEIDHGAR